MNEIRLNEVYFTLLRKCFENIFPTILSYFTQYYIFLFLFFAIQHISSCVGFYFIFIFHSWNSQRIDWNCNTKIQGFSSSFNWENDRDKIRNTYLYFAQYFSLHRAYIPCLFFFHLLLFSCCLWQKAQKLLQMKFSSSQFKLNKVI